MEQVRKAAEIRSLGELQLPQDTLFYLRRDMDENGLSLEQAILAARQVPSATSVWRRDLRRKLDELGLIRHDFDEMSLRVGRLYLAIDKTHYRGRVVGSLEDFESNEQYELYQNLPPEKIVTVREAVRAALDPRMSAIILMRFGLSGGDPQTLQEIADRCKITRARTQQLENSAKRYLRRAEGAWLPELYMFGRETLEAQIDEKVAELSVLQDQYREVLERATALTKEMDELAKLRDAAFIQPFRSPAEPEIIPKDDAPDEPLSEEAQRLATSLEDLDLSVRCYNCLIRWGQMETVGDILSYPPKKLLRLRNFGRVSANELVAKMHEIGYPDFEIPGLEKLNEQAAKYNTLAKKLASGEPADGAKVDELSEIDKVMDSSD